MINLHYEINICQKIYNRVIMTVYVKCVVRFNVHHTLLFFGHKARAKLEAMTSLVKEISKRFLFYTLYLCTFKAEILFVRLFSIPRILLLIVRNGMFLTTKINSIPFEFFWWIFRWYVAEAGDARSKQDILIRIVWPPQVGILYEVLFNFSITWFFHLNF